MKNVLIVESPGKLKTLRKILGAGWDVQPSVGHVTQLAKDGADGLGFDIADGKVVCRYEPNGDRGKKVLMDLSNAVARAEQVYLATDPDREGEAISWHLARELKLRGAQRVTFSEITEQAVRSAISRPRAIDEDLVAAQRARQCLDRLVGFRISPVLWSAVDGAKSAGRVQSAALHILCTREAEIQAFKPQKYWSVWVEYPDQSGSSWRAFYKGGADSEEVEGVHSDDAAEGKQVQAAESTRVLSAQEAERLVNLARSSEHRVLAVEGKSVAKNPPPPLTTSSLQQVAGARLALSPEDTMRVAQSLYEGVEMGDGPHGLITYMRTDSVELSVEFVEATRNWLGEHDPANLPQKTIARRNKEGAQAAHEAIRPTHVEWTPAQLKPHLNTEQYGLYELIWLRAVASLCAPAGLRKTRVQTRSGEANWEARGMSVEAAGYTRYWDDLASESTLPTVTQDEVLVLGATGSDGKQTIPPPRYSEPKLVQQMERAGIGRPSTYAPTMKTLKERAYMSPKGKVLVPTELGMKVDALLAQHFSQMVDSGFTAQMEASLDAIAEGKVAWEEWLPRWNSDYLEPALIMARQKIVPLSGGRSAAGRGKPLELSKEKCPECSKPLGKVPTQKVEKGYFLKCEQCPDLVLFYSKYKESWERPKPKSDPAAAGGAVPSLPQPKSSTHPCPVCKKKRLEEFFFRKEGEVRSLLRCSDPKARSRPDHKEVAYFKARGCWWSKKDGELPVEAEESSRSS